MHLGRALDCNVKVSCFATELASQKHLATRAVGTTNCSIPDESSTDLSGRKSFKWWNVARSSAVLKESRVYRAPDSQIQEQPEERFNHLRKCDMLCVGRNGRLMRH